LHLKRIPTKDNLFRRHILAATNILCSNDCGCLEVIDHLFLQCDFVGRLWSLISGWLGFGTTHHSNILDHLLQFGGLGGFFKNCRLTFNIIRIWVLYIIWKERNARNFNLKDDLLPSLVEKVKVQMVKNTLYFVWLWFPHLKVASFVVFKSCSLIFFLLFCYLGSIVMQCNSLDH